MGGLGNQMFQYSAAKALAERHKVPLKVDLSFLNDRSAKENFTFREYELGCFNKVTEIASKEEISIFKRQNRFYRSMMTLVGMSMPLHYYEQSFNYNELFNQLPKDTLLEGYFQSEKYFIQIRSLLLETFKWRSPASGINLSLIENIKSTTSVSLHIRRGDFAENKAINSFHGLCDINYYCRAITHVNLNTQNPTFFIFSDDINWAKKELKMTSKVIYIDHNIGKESYWDMRLMSYCKHNIIANSSFSWWAAWLNENQSKIVCAPEKWFNDTTIDTSDLIPNTWKRI